MRFRDVFVESLVYELPPVSVSTAEIEGELSPLYRRMGITPGWLETVTGIRERRLWRPGVQPSQVATRVGARALAAMETGARRPEPGRT